jgi:DNA-binding SARP family transcriptional activator
VVPVSVGGLTGLNKARRMAFLLQYSGRISTRLSKYQKDGGGLTSRYSNPAKLGFSLLGPMQINSGNDIIQFRGTTITQILAALLMNANSWVSESRLIELAWGSLGATPNALHCAVSRMRRIFRDIQADPSIIQHSMAGYRIVVSNEQLDTLQFTELGIRAHATPEQNARFDLLHSSLKLWRGAFLEGAPEHLRTAFEVITIERARIDRTCEFADLAISLGRGDEALSMLQKLAIATPYDEPLQARLLVLTGSLGRRADALQLFEHIRHKLSEDLGVSPSKELLKAHMIVLNES